jgi:hypothetical protein
VINDPERSAASMIITARESPEMTELRGGKSRARHGAKRRFADDGAVCTDGVVQFEVLRRIGMIEAAGQHADGAGLERASMRGGVHSAGETGNDDIACFAESGRQAFGEHQRGAGALA